jgi:hypothetical protein
MISLIGAGEKLWRPGQDAMLAAFDDIQGLPEGACPRQRFYVSAYDGICGRVCGGDPSQRCEQRGIL